MTVELDYSELAREFLNEGMEILVAMEEAVVQLERRPGDPELVQTIFRSMHTLKGNASCLDLPGLTHVAHVVEDGLESLVDQSVAADSECVTILLRIIDALRALLPEASQGSDVTTPRGDEIVLPLQQWCRRQLDFGVVIQDAFPESASRKGEGSRPATGAVRLDVERLDALVNLTGELAIARGRLGALIHAGLGGEVMAERFEESERLSQQLQELVSRMRMVAVGRVLRPFVRSVRDLAAKHGKRARLVIIGAEVEVDLSVIEHLRDPLMHMIRNSVDHGIETPAERIAKGKPPEGLLTISARTDGSSIIVEVTDDGVGLDRNRILQKARSLGMAVDPERLPEQEIYRLILQPGFSTAATVTELSGRGVGLDVVRRNVEALRGSIDIDSREGAVFTLRLPLTLAIIDGFAVGVGEDTHIVSLDAVVECLDLPTGVELGESGEALMDLRGEPLPLIELGRSLGAPPSSPRFVVVVRAGATRIGLAVDRLEGQHQTVIKPIPSIFRRMREISGSSILSDGRVGLVLDVNAVVQNAIRRRNEYGSSERTLLPAREETAMTTIERADDGGQYLTFFVGAEEYAIGVLRIREIIEFSGATHIPGMPASVLGVINLRGHVVPVIDLAAKFGAGPGSERSRSCVVIVEIVIEGANTVVGLVADAVNQVIELSSESIESPPALGTRARIEFLHGLGKHGDRFVLILDIDRLLSEEELDSAELAVAMPEDGGTPVGEFLTVSP